MFAGSAASKIKKGFKVCDTNKDDCLSLGEIKKCVQKFDLDIPKPKVKKKTFKPLILSSPSQVKSKYTRPKPKSKDSKPESKVQRKGTGTGADNKSYRPPAPHLTHNFLS